ncbi:MAG TPA: secretin N-terminal domain-containing protein [Lacunisphaera sp.]|nr:secretin N-terminal domain-containing protein [Lacunisphaera sp.]
MISTSNIFRPRPHLASLVLVVLVAVGMARGADSPASPPPLPTKSPGASPPAASPPAAPPATPQAAATPAALPDERATATIGPVKLRNETIDQVLELLERWTGRTMLRPPTLPGGSYNLTLDEGTTREDAVRALETLLTLNGIALTPLGEKYYKVTGLNVARAESPLFIEGRARDLPPSGQIASKLFQPKFLRISEFLPQIAALLNPGLGAAPVMFEKSNAALVTDSISNLQRVEALLERLDHSEISANATKFYSLHSAKASDVVGQLHTLLGGALQMQLSAATSYLADDRTNQIVLVADPDQVPFFDDLINRLDVKSDPNTRNEVIFLKNANAPELATLLTQLVQGKNQAARQSGTEGARGASSTAPGSGPPSAPVSQQPAAAGTMPGLAGSSQEFSDFLTVLPEPRSNALVVSGTVDDIRLIRDLVSKVDVRLPQVRIEVVIAEVTLGDEATSGISELGLRVAGNRLVGFSGAAAGVDVTNGTLTNGAGGGTDLAADIRLFTTPRKNNTTILSVPTIITTHNKEGSIFVGEQRPVISSYLNDASAANGNVGSGYRSTVTEKDIGIELTVKPLIGIDGSVQLEITQDVNDVLSEITIDGNPQPVIGRRTTKSFISAKNGEIIVLGGLQRTSRQHTTNRLGPIPFLGDLFGTRHRADTRTDLVFFLRPYVLTNTSIDNAEALHRIDAGPQRDAVHRALNPSVAPVEPPPRHRR